MSERVAKVSRAIVTTVINIERREARNRKINKANLRFARIHHRHIIDRLHNIQFAFRTSAPSRSIRSGYTACASGIRSLLSISICPSLALPIHCTLPIPPVLLRLPSSFRCTAHYDWEQPGASKCHSYTKRGRGVGPHLVTAVLYRR